ncbi:hypothetical protein BDZ89DRAFT_991983 [Hymenopellis radicata]|nr:hypothetical protein BDZ89DRAFT_991983 [Hymenopellis radicata]
MWCTRWFLPLLLLPLPTAPPYFLLLFIFSLTMHAKPCFYCIVLISSIFVSSCYWQPFSLDTSLATPWSENVTTYGEALLWSLPPDIANNTESLPTSIRAADRCWCDMSSGSFFEPFNVTRWEHNTVNRMREDLEKRWASSNNNNNNSSTAVTPAKVSVASSLWSLFARSRRPTSSPSLAPSNDDETIVMLPAAAFRHKYDLSSYGVNMLLDFGWSE